MIVAPASDHPGGLDLENLVRFLSDRSEIDIKLVHGIDYKEAIAALRDGTAELGWLGPYAYLEAAREELIESFAVGLPRDKNTPNYQSVFITRPASSIETLDQAKNKRIAISDPHSTSGYILPKKELLNVGIHLGNEAEFEKILHVSNHDEAIRAVLDGRADIAPVSSVNLEENIAQGLDPKAFRVVHRSQDIPGAPLVYLKSLAPEVKSLIKELVLKAHEFIDVGGYGGAMERYIDPSEGHRRYLESYLRPQWGWRTWGGLATLIAVTVAVMVDLEVDLIAIFKNTSVYLVDVIGRMIPPDFTDFGALLLSMLETIEIAFLGTLLAIGISIPIGLFSSRNIAPHYSIYLAARVITIFFRAIPEFIMAMILVIAIGFGAMPGVLALGFHTMGFLAKFYAEAMEHVNPGPVEALGSMGANRYQIVAFAIIPQVIPSFIGNNLYIFDRNIRMATMLGIVGAGGIGYELQSSFRLFEYPRVSAIIIVIFAVIFLIDMVSSFIRSRIQ